jgi:hypothetical protein
VVDDHVDIVAEDGELVGDIILNPKKDYHQSSGTTRPKIHRFECPG